MNTCPTIHPAVRPERIGDELYLYSTEGETLTVLNTTAMLIWSLCDGSHTPEEMAGVLQEIYPEADAGMLMHDIRSMLEEFQSKGILA